MYRFLVAAYLLVIASFCSAQPLLEHAHAHNDYEHSRPLFDALDRGFCSVEADVWLVDGKLLVAHDFKQTKPDRTLESLYLEPLRKRVKVNMGFVYPQPRSLYLLIDIKSEAVTTYSAVSEVLKRYRDLFDLSNAKATIRPVTVVISGNRNTEAMLEDKARLAGMDGRPDDLKNAPIPGLFTWISESWGALFKWRGAGPMPDDELQKLEDIVKRSHARGIQVRFWGTPDRPELWMRLFRSNVDWIGSDNLDALKKFHDQLPRALNQ